MDKSRFEQVAEALHGPLTAPAITEAELLHARPSPDRIVQNLLYADVGVLIAPGGVGKTTLMLHVAMNIVLGRPVFGETVDKHGRVLFLTAEDTRDILVARLRACMDGLSDAERARVMDGVRIADVSGCGYRLTVVEADVVRPAPNVDGLIELCREIKPVLIVIDPAVSFGVGESRVNDAEQGLVEAARRLRNDLNCCVLYIHHSGKANARERTLDQYSGRGGSAFADGSRMVLVLQNLPPDEFEGATGQRLESGETGLILARPKMSYCPPPGDIYIRRAGYSFDRVDPIATSKTQKLDANADQVLALLTHELKEQRRHSKNTIEHADAGSLKRGEIRAALARLEADGRIEYRDGPGIRKSGPQKYIHLLTSPSESGGVVVELHKKEAETSPEKNENNLAAAYREINSGEVSPEVELPTTLHFAKFTRRGFGEVGEVCLLSDAPKAKAADEEAF